MTPSQNLPARHVHAHLYFIVVGVFLFLIGDSFLSERISFVGMENAILSRHVTSMELYDFWNSSDHLPDIGRDYMPLGYILEGWLLQNVSNSYLTEKVFSVALFLVCAFLVVYVWHLAGKKWRTGWIPLAFWLLVPIVGRSATQNLIELPHTICTLIALSAQMKLYTYRRNYILENPGGSFKEMRKMSVIYNIGTALWLSLAFFFKGFASFYVFLYPVVVWLFSMKEAPGSPLKSLGFMALGFVTFVGGTCLISPTVRFLVDEYLKYRLTTWLHPGLALTHIGIYWTAIRQMGLGFVALLVVWGISMGRGKYGSYMLYWKHKEELEDYEYENVRKAYIFFASALLGVFAVLFDEDPQVYSLLPVLPTVAYGCAFVAYDSLVRLTDRSTDLINSVLATLAVGLITLGMVRNFNQIGGTSANENELVSDLHAVLPLLEENETVTVSPEVLGNDNARAYFLRYKNIRFDTDDCHRFLLHTAPDLTGLPLRGARYELCPVITQGLFLFQRVDVSDEEWGEWSFNINE